MTDAHPIRIKTRGSAQAVARSDISSPLNEHAFNVIMQDMANGNDLYGACQKNGMDSASFVAAVLIDKTKTGRLFKVMDLMALFDIASHRRLVEQAQNMATVPEGMKLAIREKRAMAEILAPHLFGRMAKAHNRAVEFEERQKMERADAADQARERGENNSVVIDTSGDEADGK